MTPRRVALALVLAFAAGRATAAPRSTQVTESPAASSAGPVPAWSEAPEYTPAASPAPVAVTDPPRSQPTNAALTDAANVAPGRPTTNPTPVSRRLAGLASWYCLAGRSACTAGYGPDCACAAAGAALQVGDWRGRVVTVCAAESCVRVALVDTMAHPGRLVDLYASQFSRLAPLSAGLLTVRVEWP